MTNEHHMTVESRAAGRVVYACHTCARKVSVANDRPVVVIRGDFAVKHRGDPMTTDLTNPRPSDKALELEFAYTTWQDSCRVQGPQPNYVCRRPKGHVGLHAAGFQKGRKLWSDRDSEPLTEDEVIEFGRQLEAATDDEILAAAKGV